MVKKFLFSAYVGTRRRLSGYGLARVPGVARVRDSMFRALTSDEIVEMPTKEGRFLVNKRDEGIVPQLITTGEYDPTLSAVIKDCLQPGMRAVDVGANFGFYTVIASKRVGSAGLVYAFEPDPGNYNLLLRNIEMNNCGNVRPFCLAIGEKAYSALLYRDPANLGNHSLCSNNISSDDVDSVSITVQPLDSLLPDLGFRDGVDFIKIDVQGAEEAVINGASTILSMGGPQILMEFWPKGLKNFGTSPLAMLRKLMELGFEISVVDRELHEVDPDSLANLSALSEYPGRDHVDLLLSRRNSGLAAKP